jgi:phosphonate transport system ATP-binding protein
VIILEIEDLHKSYDNNVPVLCGINLAVHRGEFVGIIGLSGSGKSTLLRCINRLVEPSSGHIRVPAMLITGNGAGSLVDVVRLNRFELRRLRRKIGMIFQHRQTPVRHRKCFVWGLGLSVAVAQHAAKFYPR